MAHWALGPRYLLVYARLSSKTNLGAPSPLSGSRARKTRTSPNFISRMESGRDPAGARRRRYVTARTRHSPSLNPFSVVLSVVSICSLRSSRVIERFSRFLCVSLNFFPSFASAYV